MAANPHGNTSFSESTKTKQAQSPVSPVPSSSHLMFNNVFSSMYAGSQPGSVTQGYSPSVSSNAFPYPLVNNGNIETSALTTGKADVLQDSVSHGSSSMGSDVSSHGSPENESWMSASSGALSLCVNVFQVMTRISSKWNESKKWRKSTVVVKG